MEEKRAENQKGEINTKNPKSAIIKEEKYRTNDLSFLTAHRSGKYVCFV